jgi:hypothetical protein
MCGFDITFAGFETGGTAHVGAFTTTTKPQADESPA